VSEPSFTTARLDDVPVVDDGRVPSRIVRHHLGVQAFGINAWLSRGAGQPAINEHEEEDTGEEELYLVLAGHAVFTIDGEEVDAPEGTLILVEPAAKRSAVAKEDGTTILAVGGPVGRAYRPSGWELWSHLRPAFEAGDYERVIDELTPIVAEHPAYAALSYNLACAESLAGRPDDALRDLHTAVEADPDCARYARSDSDFDAIRHDARFTEIVGSA
jgi:quercetin dioxygenase-like cupin family protein